MSDPSKPVFVALRPDPRLNELVQGYKDRTRTLVGPQLYLDDPPHLTVFLSSFSPSFRAAPLLRDLVTSAPPPAVRLVGWHTFEADALTGRNTLVCAIHPDDKQTLRGFQARVVEALSPHRDIGATNARFAGRLQHLIPEQRENVARFGFPFLAAGWEPHFTVASIDPPRWGELLADLGPRPPHGTYNCAAVEEYELDGITPRLRERIEFR